MKQHTHKGKRRDPLLTQEKALRNKSAPPAEAKARIHRVRFCDYNPSSICSLALTPPTWAPSTSFSHARLGREVLAVGRGNGDIEIHVWIGLDGEELSKRPGSTRTQKQAWVMQSRLPAHLPSGAVDHLVFAHQTALSESDLDLISSPEEATSAKAALLRTPPRLFSSSGASTVFEWEWLGAAAGRQKATLPSEGGNVWSLAVNPSGTSLAMGCEDGAIRLVNISDGDFEIVKRLDKVNTRPLSLAWGPPSLRAQSASSSKGKAKATEQDLSESVMEDTYLVAGGADSTLRKWDVRTGRVISKLQTDQAGRDPTLVWSVKVLSDHTIVSGDSMGLIKVWDGAMGIQKASIKAHKADVLCMAIAADEQSIYTSGVDQMTVQISLISADKSQPPDTPMRSQWIITSTRRLHHHDVRAMVHSPPFSPSAAPSPPSASTLPILVSGGIDMALNLTPACPAGSSAYATALEQLGNPLNEAPSTIFDRSTPRKISYVPQRARAVHVAREARLLVSQYETSLAIWRLSPVGSSAGSVVEDTEDGWQKCCELTLNCSTNLVTSAVSPDGRWLATSDRYEAKLFSLTTQLDGSIETKRIKAFSSALEAHPVFTSDRAAASLAFSPDSRRLVFAGLHSSNIAVIRLPVIDPKKCEIVKVFSQHAIAADEGRAMAGSVAVNGKANGMNGSAAMAEDSESEEEEAATPAKGNASIAAIACLAISDDNQWLASADMARRLHVFHLDSLQHHCALPSPDLPPTSLVFIPLAPSNLIVGLPNNTLQVFDVEARRLAPWAKSLVTDPIKQLFDLREPLIGLSLEPLHSKGSSSASASPLPSPMVGIRSASTSRGSSSPAPKPRIPVLVAWGSTWLCRIRLPHAMPTSAAPKGVKRPAAAVEEEEAESAEEAEEQSLVREDDITVSHKYQPLLALDFLGPGELVLVERPYFTMAADLPPAYYPSGKYGT